MKAVTVAWRPWPYCQLTFPTEPLSNWSRSQSTSAATVQGLLQTHRPSATSLNTTLTLSGVSCPSSCHVTEDALINIRLSQHIFVPLCGHSLQTWSDKGAQPRIYCQLDGKLETLEGNLSTCRFIWSSDDDDDDGDFFSSVHPHTTILLAIKHDGSSGSVIQLAAMP